SLSGKVSRILGRRRETLHLLNGAVGQQVEGNETVVCQGAGEVRAQMAVELRVVLEPPEGGPGENHEARPGAAQSFQLPDGCVVVGGRPPVLPVSFQERKDVTFRSDLASPAFTLVNQDKRSATRDQPFDLLCRLAHPGYPLRLLTACNQPLKWGRQQYRGH